MKLEWRLTREEMDRLCPVHIVKADRDGNLWELKLEKDQWLDVGYIPTPKSRLAWFLYDLVHGLAMHIPVRKVILYSLRELKKRGQ